MRQTHLRVMRTKDASQHCFTQDHDHAGPRKITQDHARSQEHARITRRWVCLISLPLSPRALTFFSPPSLISLPRALYLPLLLSFPSSAHHYTKHYATTTCSSFRRCLSLYSKYGEGKENPKEM